MSTNRRSYTFICINGDQASLFTRQRYFVKHLNDFKNVYFLFSFFASPCLRPLLAFSPITHKNCPIYFYEHYIPNNLHAFIYFYYLLYALNTTILKMFITFVIWISIPTINYLLLKMIIKK